MLDNAIVVSIPEVMSGDPCIRGTRIAVTSIIANLKAGDSAADIHAAYPTLPEGAVEAAVRWAADNGIAWRN